MVQIRRGLLIFLVVLAVAAGSLATCFYLNVSPSDLAAGPGAYVSVAKDRYGELTRIADTYEKAEFLRDYIEDNYYVEVSDEDVMNGVYYGMFNSLDDPYSNYMSKNEYQNELATLTGDYYGIGVTVAADVDTDRVIVISPTPGTPAEAAGIRSGDLILAVDGGEYTANQLDVCAAAIRGEEGTDVVLSILRKNDRFDLTITRTHITLQSVTSEMRSDGLGYIQISSFLNNTGIDFAAAVKSLEDQGATGLIIDLRNNGGGLVNAAIGVADVLMDKATVVYTEDHDHNRSYYQTTDGKTSLPSVILINEGSASSSEILAAGLQDNGICKVVGTQSFGKGIIQNVEELSDGSAVKLTILQYFTPGGEVIHKVGITPDYIVELTDDCYDEDGLLINDLQLKRAAELLK